MKKFAIFLFCISFLSAPVWADKVDDLEQKIQNLEKQLLEMKDALASQKQAQPAAAAVLSATPSKDGMQPMQLIGPGGTLNIGGDIRWRGRYYDNLFDFNSKTVDRSDSFRFRPRVWFDWKPNDKSEAYVRFTKEWLYGGDNKLPGYDVEAKDVMFDNAWYLVKDVMNSPFDIKIGRQDIMYGEGFVILDGTPQDGSQTASFDAAIATLKLDWGTTDFLLAKPYENNQMLNDDEDLYGIYNKWNFGGFGVEPYVFLRNKNQRANKSATYNSAGVMTVNYDPSPRQQTFLVGLRGTHKMDIDDGVNLALAAEIGKEWGEVDFTGGDVPGGDFYFSHDFAHPKEDIDAWGGTVNATLSFPKTVWKPSIKAAFSYMTGDDPKTSDYEGWDDIYGEWPKYSELLAYTYVDAFKGRSKLNDGDVGFWGNMILPEIGITVSPFERFTQAVRYIYFMADEATGPGKGTDRGNDIQTISSYEFTKNLSGHYLFEWFDPGNYYKKDADAAIFMRFQLMYKF